MRRPWAAGAALAVGLMLRGPPAAAQSPSALSGPDPVTGMESVASMTTRSSGARSEPATHA